MIIEKAWSARQKIAGLFNGARQCYMGNDALFSLAGTEIDRIHAVQLKNFNTMFDKEAFGYCEADDCMNYAGDFSNLPEHIFPQDTLARSALENDGWEFFYEYPKFMENPFRPYAYIKNPGGKNVRHDDPEYLGAIRQAICGPSEELS